VQRPRSPREELAEVTPHGRVYLRRLIRAQLTLSILALLAFGGLIGSLPLLLVLAPHLQDVEVAAVPLPVALLVFPIFPLIVLIGWLYQRRADALDNAFRELLEDR
jgi:O-antigen/teichoic acid export membrane protein